MSLSRVRSSLGTPIYEDEDILLYQGDSLELMRELDDELINLTITSPPYNIGKEYEIIKPLADYIQWTSEWTRLVYKCTRPDGAFWLNLGYVPFNGRAKALPLPYLIWDVVPFFLIQEVVWNYGAGVAGRLFFSPRNEKFLWFAKDQKHYIFNLDDVRDTNVKYPNQKKNGKLKCNPSGKNPTDVWQISKVTSGKNRSSRERTDHPAQFPIALISRIVRASSDQGALIFDPFVGSGSTIEAAIRNGRKVVGIEIDPSSVSTAIRRIKSVRREMILDGQQQSLWLEEPFQSH